MTEPFKLGSVLPPDLNKLKEDDVAMWQSSVVDSVCKRLKIPTPRRREMAAWAKSRGGSDDMTFEGFHEVIPDFPVFFACKLFNNLGKTTPLSKLFAHFDKTVLYKTYVSMFQDVPEAASSLNFGLVFRWPNLLRTGDTPADGCLVLHNRRPVPEVSGTRLMWVLNQASNTSTESKAVITLYTTPLRVLLSEILHEKAWEL